MTHRWLALRWVTKTDAVPLVLFHGDGSTIESMFGKVLPVFAGSRRVIAMEEQMHGCTPRIVIPAPYCHSRADGNPGLRDINIRPMKPVGAFCDLRLFGQVHPA